MFHVIVEIQLVSREMFAECCKTVFIATSVEKLLDAIYSSLIANITRCFFWLGDRFELTLLVQSILMILAQVSLLPLKEEEVVLITGCTS